MGTVHFAIPARHPTQLALARFIVAWRGHVRSTQDKLQAMSGFFRCAWLPRNAESKTVHLRVIHGTPQLKNPLTVAGCTACLP